MIESEVFDLLKISDNLFTYDSPLGMVFDEFKRLSSMEDDLSTYELEVIEDFYFSCIEQPHDSLTNDDLGVYEPRVCYEENEQIYAEVVILINKRLIRLIDIIVEQWLDLKFSDHKKVDKEIMEEVVSTWLNMLAGDLHRFKTYDDYMDAWIYEWNKEVPLVEEKPCLDDGTWKEPDDKICHECKPFQFKSGHIKWPTCNSNKDGYCNGGHLPGMIQVRNMTYFQNYEWYDALEDGDLKDKALKEKAILEGSWGHKNREGNNFCSWLKECFDNYQELDYEQMRKLEEYWWGKKEEEESSDDAWSNYSPNDNDDAIQVDQEWFASHEPMPDDDDIMDLEDYLIRQDVSYYVDEEDERFKEKKQITWDAL
ncbi:hypothetical protein Tco_0717322 [Tanacetum coccineum]